MCSSDLKRKAENCLDNGQLQLGGAFAPDSDGIFLWEIFCRRFGNVRKDCADCFRGYGLLYAYLCGVWGETGKIGVKSDPEKFCDGFAFGRKEVLIETV